MKPLAYQRLSQAEAEAALEEFLAEREPALRRLEESVGTDVVLDRSVESLTPLWLWVKDRIARSEPRSGVTSQPTWSRFARGSAEPLSGEGQLVIDGLISYVADVIQTAVPDVEWVLNPEPHPRSFHRNQPSLQRGQWFTPVADVVANQGRRLMLDQPPKDRALEDLVRVWLMTMTDPQSDPVAPADDELVDVVDLRLEDGDRHRPSDPDFEIGLDDWLAGTHPKLLTTLRKALSKEPGVVKVVEEDREVLLVHAPDWDQERLTAWVSRRLPR